MIKYILAALAVMIATNAQAGVFARSDKNFNPSKEMSSYFAKECLAYAKNGRGGDGLLNQYVPSIYSVNLEGKAKLMSRYSFWSIKKTSDIIPKVKYSQVIKVKILEAWGDVRELKITCYSDRSGNVQRAVFTETGTIHEP